MPLPQGNGNRDGCQCRRMFCESNAIACKRRWAWQALKRMPARWRPRVRQRLSERLWAIAACLARFLAEYGGAILTRLHGGSRSACKLLNLGLLFAFTPGPNPPPNQNVLLTRPSHVYITLALE